MARNLPTATMRHGSGCPAQAGLQTGEMGPTADSGPGPREQVCADGHTGAAHRDGPFGVCRGTFQVPQGPPREPPLKQRRPWLRASSAAVTDILLNFQT